jgi:hypothetical protein
MTSVGSGSEVGWLNDSDGIVGSTLHLVMMSPHRPAASVDCGPLEVSSPVLLETTSDMANEFDEENGPRFHKRSKRSFGE